MLKLIATPTPAAVDGCLDYSHGEDHMLIFLSEAAKQGFFFTK